MDRAPVLAVATLVAFSVLARAEEKKPPAPSPVPIPYPNVATSTSAAQAPRDAASGQATGKRIYKPVVFTKEWGAAILLDDGRTFRVNRETGAVLFGDGAQGARPETGHVPPDGTYRLGGGATGNVVVRGGKVVTLPTSVATPRAATKTK